MAKDPFTDLHLTDSRAQIAKTRRHLAATERRIAASLAALESSRQLLAQRQPGVPETPRLKPRKG